MMRTRAIAALAILAAAAGCHRPVQTPGSAVIEGDSITWQWAVAGGSDELPGVQIHSGPGWQLDFCETAVTPVCDTPLENVIARVHETKADRVVWLLGTNETNEVWDDGWNRADEDLAALGLTAQPDDSCVVWVLPWLGPGSREAHRAEVLEARIWLTAAAERLPNVRIVDWRPYAEGPGVLAADGIHLAGDPETGTLTPEAYAARRDVIRRALDACAGPSASAGHASPAPRPGHLGTGRSPGPRRLTHRRASAHGRRSRRARPVAGRPGR